MPEELKVYPTEEKVNPYNAGKDQSKFLGRLTVVESIYYQPSPEEEPQGVENRYTISGEEDEQVYSRLKTRVEEEWQLLDTGWIDKPLLVIIKNRAGIHTQVNPTDEQKKQDRRKIVQVSYHGLTIATEVVYPSCSVRIMPCYLMADKLQIRCNYSHTFCDIHAYPGIYKF